MVGATFATLRDFRVLYEAEYGFVWSAVRRLGVPGPVAEDAVQDTFLVAYRKRKSFEAGPARPWLYGIARGVASNYRRSARRVARKHQALSSAVMMGEGARDPSPHESVQALDRFLSGLSDRDRELFVLSEVEGMTGPELAASLQTQPRTIYRRLAELRARFETQAIGDGALRPRRPRASAASWVAILPALRTASVGWTGITASPAILASVVLGLGTAGVLAVVVSESRPPHPDPAAVTDSPRSPTATPVTPPADTPVTRAASVATAAPPDPAPVQPIRRTSRPSRAATPAATRTDSLAAENALLRRATQAAAAKRFSEALEATQQHAKQFPQSAMTDLRRALRIESLCGLGKTKQARGEAHAFVTENPDAPMVDRINRACMTKTPRSGQ